MHPLNDIYAYWDKAQIIQALYAISNYTINEHTVFVSRQELASGRLLSSSHNNLKGATDVVIVPIYGLNILSVFIPCMLTAKVASNGSLAPAEYNKLPIVPRAVLEPSKISGPVVLGNIKDFDNYYTNCAPIWMGVDYEPTWQDQLNYAFEYLQQNSQPRWEEQLIENSYLIDYDSALMIPVHSLIKPMSFNNKIINNILDLQDVSLLSLDAIDTHGLAIVKAQRNSGKTQVIASKVMDDWMASALSQTMPPLHVWLANEDFEPKVYANIFDCYPETQLWLTKDIRQEIFAPQICSDFSLSFCIQNFLSLLSNYLKMDVVHLGDAREILLNILKHNIDNLHTSKKLLLVWDDSEKSLITKYHEHGGIHNKIRELKQVLTAVQQELRHLSIIVSLWQEKFKLVIKLPQWFDNIKLLNYLKNQRLYRFYAQYFPDDKVSMLSRHALNAKLNAKLQKLQDREKHIHDLINKCNQELIKLEAIKLECKNWFKQEYNYDIDTHLQAITFLDTVFVKDLHLITLRYYEAFVLDDFSWSQGSSQYNKYFINAKIDKIDCLFIEHANYLPTMLALPLLTIANKVAIFGNEDKVEQSLFPLALDYQLCKVSNLLRNELDFVDLQSQGILVSTGNLWQFVTKSCPVVNMLNGKYQTKPMLQCVDVQHKMEEFYGSRCNTQELSELYNLILSTYEIYGFANDWIIYTTFKGQVKKIELMLTNTIFAKIPVKLLQAVNLTRSKIAFVSLVHHKLNYENENVILNNLLHNTTHRIVIVGSESALTSNITAEGVFPQTSYS